MKSDIHPEYATATVKCACGSPHFQTRSTQAEIHTDVCAACHPYYTGKQRLMDTAGRIERFRQKFARKPAATAGRDRDSTGARADRKLRRSWPTATG